MENTPPKTADVRLRLDDRRLFGNDAGEDEEIEVLNSYFVDQPAFKDFLDNDVGLKYVRARKGMGKSALISKFAYDLAMLPSKPMIIQAIPSSLVGMLAPPTTESSVVMENYWKQVICRAINFEIANAVGFAWNDDQITLVETAELAGFKGKNIIGALTSRLLGKINIFGAIEIKPNPSTVQSNDQMLKRIQEEGRDAREVWFLLDDIDANFKNTPDQTMYISSFFAACRSLVNSISGLSIRATVRSDVWTSLRKTEELDKSEQYMCDIVWTVNQQKSILVKRIYAYVMRNSPDSYVSKNWTMEKHGDDFIELAFSKRFNWGNSAVPAINVLRILAAGRPRWMAQLCRSAGNQAVSNNHDRIGASEINDVMVDFGKNRLSDLYKEHVHQFPDLGKVIEAFSNGNRRYTTDDLIKKITGSYVKIKSANSIPEIDGMPYTNSIQIAHFLFKCGFVVGHVIENEKINEFVSYDGRPDLLKEGTNLDDGMVWEVQASYRKALRIK
jgi:hypothetical protein